MRKVLLSIIILLSIECNGQIELKRNIIFENEKIEYSRIDYSGYGLAQIFVIMYEDNYDNRLLKINATNKLNEESNLYHTLYFFIKVPSKYSKTQKETIFYEILNQIETEEELNDNHTIYLNFDSDYSGQYQAAVLNNNKKNNIRRIFTEINSKNIENGLSIIR